MAKVRYYSAKRRAIYAKGEDFHCLEIFDRDNWTCIICRQPIDRRLRYPSWWCATLEHLIPLSHPMSPGHIKANTFASHLKCNQDKGNELPTKEELHMALEGLSEAFPCDLRAYWGLSGPECHFAC